MKKNRFTFVKLINGQNYSKIQNFPEIDDDHNLTEHARNWIFVSKCVFLDTLSYSTNNSTKNGFGPF